jgi:IclR family KDG regulon transcriptional repressor
MARKGIDQIPDESEGMRLSSVVRTLTIFEELAATRQINLEQLAKRTRLPKPTLHRFMQTLCDLGYVYRDDKDEYSLTLKMFSLASRALEWMDLPARARPLAEKLASELGETVHIGIREEDHAIYVLKVESKYTLRMYSRVGKAIPLYCTAIGKLLLSDFSPDELDRYLDSVSLNPYTAHTITAGEKLRKELANIAAKGLSRDREEHEEGITCLAAPIRDYTGRVIAALSVSWPVFRFRKEGLAAYERAIRGAAESISRLLGYLG